MQMAGNETKLSSHALRSFVRRFPNDDRTFTAHVTVDFFRLSFLILSQNSAIFKNGRRKNLFHFSAIYVDLAFNLLSKNTCLSKLRKKQNISKFRRTEKTEPQDPLAYSGSRYLARVRGSISPKWWSPLRKRPSIWPHC